MPNIARNNGVFRDVIPISSYPESSASSMRQKCWRRHEQTCGRTSDFAIRTDVIACLSEAACGTNGLSFDCNCSLWMFLFFFPVLYVINVEILTDPMHA